MKLVILKVLFIVISLIFSINLSFCTIQKDSARITYSAGITPTAILNMVPAFQIFQKITFSEKISIGLETGYIFTHLDTTNHHTQGLRIRPSLHLTLFRNSSFNIGMYTFYNYRYFHAQRERDLLKANGAFIETVKGTRTTSLQGGGLGMNLGITNLENVVKELTFGIGVGWGHLKNNYSDQIFEPGDIFSFNRSGKSPIPIIFLNMNLILW